MSNTFPFNKISKNDAQRAGGKGASLGEMTQAGIPVPNQNRIQEQILNLCQKLL